MSFVISWGQYLASTPKEVLLIGHCLFVAHSCRSSKHLFLLNYWAGFFCAFGGGITSGLLLQDPKVPIGLFANNAIFLIWTACWWIVNYSPGDVGLRIFENFYVKTASKVCVNILRTGTILGRADSSIVRYPGSIAAPLVLGTLGGCGGKFLMDAINTGAGRLSGPSELTSPGYSWRSATFAAATYSLAVHCLGTYTPKEGCAIMTFLFVVHTLVCEILEMKLDFTEPIADVLFQYLRIPDPSDAGKGKTADISNGQKPRVAVAVTDQQAASNGVQRGTKANKKAQ